MSDTIDDPTTSQAPTRSSSTSSTPIRSSSNGSTASAPLSNHHHHAADPISLQKVQRLHQRGGTNFTHMASEAVKRICHIMQLPESAFDEIREELYGSSTNNGTNTNSQDSKAKVKGKNLQQQFEQLQQEERAQSEKQLPPIDSLFPTLNLGGVPSTSVPDGPAQLHQALQQSQSSFTDIQANMNVPGAGSNVIRPGVIANSVLANYKSQEFYMQLALSAALRSRDPKTQVGCVIAARDGAVLGVGYNSMPFGMDDVDEYWTDEKKGLRVVHAETNAILHCMNHDRLKDASVFVTLFPCANCAKMLIQARVREVVYFSFRHDLQLCPAADYHAAHSKSHSSFSTSNTAQNHTSPPNCINYLPSISNSQIPAKCRRCQGEEDSYEVSAEMLREAGIAVYPFFETRQQYSDKEHKRLDPLIFTFHQSFVLLYTLKERERKEGFIAQRWPEFNREPPKP